MIYRIIVCVCVRVAHICSTKSHVIYCGAHSTKITFYPISLSHAFIYLFIYLHLDCSKAPKLRLLTQMWPRPPPRQARPDPVPLGPDWTRPRKSRASHAFAARGVALGASLLLARSLMFIRTVCCRAILSSISPLALHLIALHGLAFHPIPLVHGRCWLCSEHLLLGSSA